MTMQADFKRFFILFSIGLLGLGLSACDRLGAFGPKHADTATDKIEHAKDLISRGDYQHALMELNAALSKSPRDPHIHLNMGWLYLYTDEPRLAKIELEKVGDLLPDSAETYHLRGSLLGYLNQHEDAVANLKKALSKAPKNSRIFFDLATSLAALNRNEEALAYLDHGFEYIPDRDLQSHLNFLLASCSANSRLKQFDEAIADCEQAAEYTPNEQEKQRILDMINNMKLIGQIETSPEADADSAQ